MQLAIIDNNAVIKTGFYKELFPNVSFPSTGPDAEWMTENSVLEVSVFKQYDNKTQKLVQSEPYIEDNKVYTVVVQDKTPEEIAADEQAQKLANRVKEVTMRQARLALLQKGLLSTVDNAIATLTGEEGEAAKINWEYSTVIDRDNVLVKQIGEMLNWSEDQLDELFTTASQIDNPPVLTTTV